MFGLAGMLNLRDSSNPEKCERLGCQEGYIEIKRDHKAITFPAGKKKKNMEYGRKLEAWQRCRWGRVGREADGCLFICLSEYIHFLSLSKASPSD